MNAFALIMLQKRIADELGVEVGTYTHRANSFHCYEKDFALLDGYVERINSGEKLTYNYAGEWDELMEDAKAEIAEKVERLRSNDNL
jgi:thymidylate synthase